jgi:hypothetical protein
MIMHSQYDGMIGITHLHSEISEDPCFLYLEKAIYDMDIVYEDSD